MIVGIATLTLAAAAADAPAPRGAELIAIAGDLELDLASNLIGADVLDELDHAGLLALTEGPQATRVMLAHAYLAPMLLESLGQLRLRRHKADLAAAFVAGHTQLVQALAAQGRPAQARALSRRWRVP